MTPEQRVDLMWHPNNCCDSWLVHQFNILQQLNLVDVDEPHWYIEVNIASLKRGIFMFPTTFN
jgi:hypothetical protein